MISTSTGVHSTVGPIFGPMVGSSKRPFNYCSNQLYWQFDRINVRPTIGPIVGRADRLDRVNAAYVISSYHCQ